MFSRKGPALDADSKAKLDDMKNLVDQATSDILTSVDWGANMQLVDNINSTRNPDVLQQIVKHIRKKLQSKVVGVLKHTLTLIEALVKNCHTPFHKEVATPKFMAEIGKLAKTFTAKPNQRDNLEVRDKTLELIQSWGEAFLPHRDTMPLFVDTYHSLRKDGLPFADQYDASRAPVLTPPPTIPGDAMPSPQAAAVVEAPGPQNDIVAALAAAAIDDLPAPPAPTIPSGARAGAGGGDDILASSRSTVEMLSQMLLVADTCSQIMSDELIRELVATCEELQPRMAALVEERITSDDVGVVLEANDELHRVLDLYQKASKGLLPRAASVGSAATTPDPAPASAPPQNDLLSMDAPAAVPIMADPFAMPVAAPAMQPQDFFATPAASPAATPGALPASVVAAPARTSVPLLSPPKSDTTAKSGVPLLSPPSTDTTSRRPSRSKASPASQDLFPISTPVEAPAAAPPQPAPLSADPFAAAPAAVVPAAPVVPASDDPFGAPAGFPLAATNPPAINADPFGAAPSQFSFPSAAATPPPAPAAPTNPMNRMNGLDGMMPVTPLNSAMNPAAPLSGAMGGTMNAPIGQGLPTGAAANPFDTFGAAPAPAPSPGVTPMAFQQAQPLGGQAMAPPMNMAPPLSMAPMTSMTSMAPSANPFDNIDLQPSLTAPAQQAPTPSQDQQFGDLTAGMMH